MSTTDAPEYPDIGEFDERGYFGPENMMKVAEFTGRSLKGRKLVCKIEGIKGKGRSKILRPQQVWSMLAWALCCIYPDDQEYARRLLHIMLSQSESYNQRYSTSKGELFGEEMIDGALDSQYRSRAWHQPRSAKGPVVTMVKLLNALTDERWKTMVQDKDRRPLRRRSAGIGNFKSRKKF